MGKKRKRAQVETAEEVTAKLDLNAMAQALEGEELEDLELQAEELDDLEDTAELDLKTEKKTKPKKKKKAKQKIEAKKSKEKSEDKEAKTTTETKEPKKEASAPKKKKAKKAKKAKTEPTKLEHKEEEDEDFRFIASEVKEASSEDISEEPIAEPEPTKESHIRNTDPSPSHVSLRQDVSVTSATMHKTMDSITKQWGSVKEVTESVTSNFERVAKQLRDLSDSYNSSMKEIIKLQSQQTPQRPSTISKLAVGFATLALIVSFLSLAFSQSVRQTVFDTGSGPAAKVLTTKSRQRERPKPRVAIVPKNNTLPGVKEKIIYKPRVKRTKPRKTRKVRPRSRSRRRR